MKTRLDFVSNSSSSSYIISVDDNPHMMVLNNPTLLNFKELVSKFGSRLFGPSEFCYDKDSIEVIDVPDDEFVKRFTDNTVFILQKKSSSKEESSICGQLYTPYAYLYLPYAAVDAYREYIKLRGERVSDKLKKLNKALYGDDPDSLYCTELYKLYDTIIFSAKDKVNNECFNVLEPVFKDMRFCYQEVNDSYRGYWNDSNDNPFDQSIDPDAPRKRGTPKVEEVMLNRKYQTYYESIEQPNDECLVDARIAFLEKLKGPMKFKRVFSNH